MTPDAFRAQFMSQISDNTITTSMQRAEALCDIISFNYNNYPQDLDLLGSAHLPSTSKGSYGKPNYQDIVEFTQTIESAAKVSFFCSLKFKTETKLNLFPGSKFW